LVVHVRRQDIDIAVGADRRRVARRPDAAEPDGTTLA
jgi:hypothetical protein